MSASQTGQTLRWARDLILSRLICIGYVIAFDQPHIAQQQILLHAKPTKKKQKQKKQPLIIFFSLQQSLFVSFPTFA
jgi:hypothetical protein